MNKAKRIITLIYVACILILIVFFAPFRIYKTNIRIYAPIWTNPTHQYEKEITTNPKPMLKNWINNKPQPQPKTIIKKMTTHPYNLDYKFIALEIILLSLIFGTIFLILPVKDENNQNLSHRQKP